MKKRLMILVGAALLLAACGPQFDPYNEVSDFRVLALKADKPWLPPDEETVIEALVFVEDDDASVTYDWEWCPLTQGPSQAYECALTYEELLANVEVFLEQFLIELENLTPEEIEEQFGVSAELVAATLADIQRALAESPEEILLPFDLGDAETALLRYPTEPELVELLCRAVYETTDLPDFIEVPDCDEGFPITVRLTARSTAPGAPPAEIISIKEVVLRYDDVELNSNPSIRDVVAKPLCLEDGEKVLCPRGFAGFPLSDAEGSVPVYYDVLYRLKLSIPESAIETFVPEPEEDADVCETDDDCTEEDAVCESSEGDTLRCATPRKESLAVTWFVQGGETQSLRTGFIDGEVALEDAETNDWTTPRANDFEGESMSLFFVIRDGRGGIDWIARTVRMTRGE